MHRSIHRRASLLAVAVGILVSAGVAEDLIAGPAGQPRPQRLLRAALRRGAPAQQGRRGKGGAVQLQSRGLGAGAHVADRVEVRPEGGTVIGSVLLFDLFGVIARGQQPVTSQRQIERLAGAAGPEFWGAYWAERKRYDSGEHSGGRYWQAVGARLGLTFEAAAIGDLIAADVEGWSHVHPEMVEFVIGLRQAGARIGLLSNISDELAAHYEARQSWIDQFHVLALSCRIGVAKPDAGAYIHCADAFGVSPSNILFIDDRAENLEGARAVGMRTHLFTSLPALRTRLF